MVDGLDVVAKFLWAPVAAVLAYFIKKRDDAMAKMEQKIDDTNGDLAAHKLHVSDNYVKNSQLVDMRASMNRIEDRLIKMYDHIIANNNGKG